MSGHGHVTPNPSGMKIRCGGPAICPECALEFVRLNYEHEFPAEPGPEYPVISDRQIGDMSLAALVSELNQLHNLGDAIYEVRSSAVEGKRWGPWSGNGWEHPAVLRYWALIDRIEIWLRKAGEPV